MANIFNPAGMTFVDASDPGQAALVLRAMLVEIKHNLNALANGREPSCPTLQLTVDDVARLVTDPLCRHHGLDKMLADLLRNGRKAGLTGVARSSTRLPAATPEAEFIRQQLTAGTPLTFVTPAAAG